MPPSSHYPIQELLQRHGVDLDTAKYVSMNELLHWELADVNRIFAKLKRQPRNFCPFNDPAQFLRSWRKRPELEPTVQWLWPTLYKAFPKWISAPRDMIEQAADDNAALCINHKGQFELRKSGYMAISHVWIEGLQQDKKRRAVASDKLDLIFKVLEKAKVQVEWIWLDVLAVPGGGGPTDNLADDLLKIRIINTLADVYTNADAVVIFDALAWQLQSRDPLEVAAVVACGAWASRIWTYQEVKMAKKALIINGYYHAFPWLEATRLLKAAERKNYNRYHNLWLTFAIMGRDDNVNICIRDVSTACRRRASGQDIDYVRAFYPLFGLEWKQGVTREQGMQELYYSQLHDATRMIFSYGQPRLKMRPGWAPSYISKLERVITEAMDVEKRGIRGQVFAAKIDGISSRLKRFGKTAWTVSIAGTEVQCVLAPGESEEMLENLDKAITGSRAYMLSPAAAASFAQIKFARPVIIVEKAETAAHDGFEAAVHCTASVVTSTVYADAKVSILLRHGSPLDSDLDNQLQYMWFQQTEESVPASAPQQEGESELHAAARNGDVARIEELLALDDDLVEGYDSRGWTPLHIAAARNHIDALRAMIPHSQNSIDIPGQQLSQSTPLGLAAEYGKAEAIAVLANAGANVHRRDDSKYTPLMVAALEGCNDAVDKLLELGADPRDSTDTESALLLTCKRTNNPAGRRRIVDHLIRAGADVNGFDNDFGWRPLHEAVEWSEDEIVRLLLTHNPNVDVRLKSLPDRTPLYIAVKKSRRVIVRMLLDAGADRNAIFHEGWTLVHLAAQCGDFEILRMLCRGSSVLDTRLVDRGFTALHMASSATIGCT